MHTNTPFVIRTTADEQRAAAAAAASVAQHGVSTPNGSSSGVALDGGATGGGAALAANHTSDSTSPRYMSFGSDGPSGTSLRNNHHQHHNNPHFMHHPHALHNAESSDPRFVHPALRPTFDALRLLRKIPQVMAGWVYVRCASGAGRLRWPAWSLFWAELRGGYLLLTREANSLAGDSAQQSHIDYIFGATHVDIARSPTRSGAVRLRLQRVSTRRSRPDSAAPNAQAPTSPYAQQRHQHASAGSQLSLVEEDDGGGSGFGGGGGLRNMLSPRDQRLSERSAAGRQAGKIGSAVRNFIMGAGRTGGRGNKSPMNGGASFVGGFGGGGPGASSTGTGVDMPSVDDSGADLVLKIPSAPEADKWEWALTKGTRVYESKQLGDFQLIDALGAGAFGRVYLVYDSVKGEYLALKVLDKSLVFRDRLHFESAVNERLTLELVHGKPFMAQLRYAFQTRNCLYLVTDFYEGGDLFSFLRAHHNDVRESQAIRIIAEVVLALQSMHEMGIVYRDLKPENVLLDKDGHVRLADLGLAKLLDRDIDYLTSTICGSLSYAAPEMLSEKQYGIAFDMWTLGVFIYQVLTGDMPFETENRSRQEILEDQRKAEIPVNGLSNEGYELVCALLRPNPLRRPTCHDLRSFPIFSAINWDDLMAKRPHKNSVKNVMDKIANEARQQESGRGGVGATSGNHSHGGAQQQHDAGRSSVISSDIGNSNSNNNNNNTENQTVGGESDIFLLRNFDPDEWSDMSFSDVSDGASTASIFRPDVNVVEELPAITKMIPGWSLTSDNAISAVVKPQLAVAPLLDKRAGGVAGGGGDMSMGGLGMGAPMGMGAMAVPVGPTVGMSGAVLGTEVRAGGMMDARQSRRMSEKRMR